MAGRTYLFLALVGFTCLAGISAAPEIENFQYDEGDPSIIKAAFTESGLKAFLKSLSHIADAMENSAQNLREEAEQQMQESSRSIDDPVNRNSPFYCSLTQFRNATQVAYKVFNITMRIRKIVLAVTVEMEKCEGAWWNIIGNTICKIKLLTNSLREANDLRVEGTELIQRLNAIVEDFKKCLAQNNENKFGFNGLLSDQFNNVNPYIRNKLRGM